MAAPPAPHEVATALRVAIGPLVRRLRQDPAAGELTLPETSTLARLERGGPTTVTAMARVEQISPQSLGATIGGLVEHGFVDRAPDPDDGRRSILSVSAAGREALQTRRDARVARMADALAADFTAAELRTLLAAAPLLERLAERL
jgi:DNA-binding MarR family transcriptional regulator